MIRTPTANELPGLAAYAPLKTLAALFTAASLGPPELATPFPAAFHLYVQVRENLTEDDGPVAYGDGRVACGHVRVVTIHSYNLL